MYRGYLTGQNRHVAIKILSEEQSAQGLKEFKAEVTILSQLRHRNIVRLVGWCAEQEYRRLVYEHMGKGTLRDHLQHLGGGPSSSPVTTSWETRVEVLLGVARDIHYLHGGADPLVIHRNVSSSNILLDVNWTPRLSGFGSAVFQAAGVEEHGGQLVEEVVGTPGYLDPEYRDTGRVSPASDVYSFGVVMLEALTGEDPATRQVDSSLMAIQNGKLRDVLDRCPATLPQFEALELVAHTAERCLYPQGKGRPSMPDVVASLEKALGIITSYG